MKKLNRKGQVMQNLGALGIGVVTLVLILTVVFLVNAQIKTQTITQATNSIITINNESITAWTNATAFSLDVACMDASCVALYNDTEWDLVPTSGYSCDVEGDTNVQITIENGSIGGSTTLYLNYTCTPPSNAFNATNKLTNATATIPGWIPLIILIMIGGLILGLVSAFKRNS